MSETLSEPSVTTELLTHELAERYASELAALANQIPQVVYTPDDILAEQKGDRLMIGKWVHSLIVLENNAPIAFVMCYERVGEDNEQYPQNTMYISELAVAKAHQRQGIARSLLGTFFERNNILGFQQLEGDVNYSIQTNSAGWNTHVIDLYKSFGFKQRALKSYPDRVDVVLGL
jgi:ribosomal protein S18 acetylase RimI-like enzyme